MKNGPKFEIGENLGCLLMLIVVLVFYLILRYLS